MKGIGFAEPETIKREEHLDGFIFGFIESASVPTSYKTIVYAFVRGDQVKSLALGSRDAARVVKFIAKV